MRDRHRRERPVFRLFLAAGLALALTACGMAEAQDSTGGTPSSPTSSAPLPLVITTTSLPCGQAGGLYEQVQLQCEGARAGTRWALEDGALPDGILMTAGGILSGRPALEGAYDFRVSVTDGVGTASRRLVLAVDTFTVTVQTLDGNEEIFGGETVLLEAVGAEGNVSFEIIDSPSGGAFDFIEDESGRATFVSGQPTEPTFDHVRATDQATGAVTDVFIEVLPHPAPHMVGEFGTTDVWYVDAAIRRGDHAMPTDLDEAMRVSGLRSSSYVPTATDRLVAILVRRTMLAALNAHFGRNEDGTRGSGVLISFPFDRPAAPYRTPAAGGWARAFAGLYNTIAIVNGPNEHLLGLAYRDDDQNSLIENDAPSGEDSLGVYVGAIGRGFNASWQNNELPNDPVGPQDADTLRALLAGQAVEGTRAEMIARMVDGFARSIALVVAHEIGHSVGLPHNDHSLPGEIMGGSVSHYPGAQWSFRAENRAYLQRVLPGPGRADGSSKISTPDVPAGGVAACALESPCRLHACDCGGRR